MSEQKPDKPKSGLRRCLSSKGTKLLKKIRSGRKDSGYASDDQLPTPPDEADGDHLSPSLTTDSQRSHNSSQRLGSQEEVEEESDNAEDNDEAAATQGIASQQKQSHWSNNKRHQISIQFNLLLEQHRTCHALYLADVREAEEISKAQLQQAQAEEEDNFEQEVGVRHRKTENSLSSSCADSDYFENMKADTQEMRRESDWHKNWQMRTSNRMYEDYRNDLDYRY